MEIECSSYFKIIFQSLIFFYIYIVNIIITQELNNIINIGIPNFQYINFASFSNGDMILETSSNIYNNNTKIFYGIKNNGRGYFEDPKTQEENYFYSLNINQSNNGIIKKNESENLIIQEANNQINTKEYLISIPKGDSYVEIIDFENNIIYQKEVTDFTDIDIISEEGNSFIPLFYNNSQCYLFCFIGKNNSMSSYSFILQIHKFNSINKFENEKTKINEIINNQTIILLKSFAGISCFKTENEKIMCFFYSNDYYIIEVYNLSLNFLDQLSIYGYNDDNSITPFCKCIHLKGEVGVFAYYSKNTDYILKITFKEYTSNITDYSISEIVLNKIQQINRSLKLNDIIKINGNKICFCVSNRKTKLSIILINLFEQMYKVRYYFLDISNLYNYNYIMRIQIHNFNKFIAFAFDYNSNQTIYDAFLIFSYPNTSDNQMILDNYIYNFSFDNYVNIDIEKEIKNNIFGYIIEDIFINDLFNCDYLKFFSSISTTKIYPNSTLKKNESINLNLSIGIYNEYNCTLKFTPIATEPDENIYDRYANSKDEINYNNSNFQKDDYFGRLTYFNIYLNEELTTSCFDNNCVLCPQNNKSFCIFCKYNFTYIDGIKNCSEKDNNFEDIISVEIINSKEINKINLNITKENLVENLTYILDNIKRDKIYEISSEDFTLKIKPSNESIPDSTNVDFLPCEKILRGYYNISDSRIITFLQMEIKNKEENSLINNIGYQAYDDENNNLNLSLCNNTNIQIFYLIKSNSSLEISFISNFKDSNIDIFNINDLFFRDICFPYSDYLDNDVILYDRIKDIYQNYSLCQEGCSYNQIDLQLMIITCDCKVKNDLNPNETYSKLVQITDFGKNSPLEIIKCYNLVFSFKTKKYNKGFWIFLIFVFLQALLLLVHLYKGITPIKEYLFKEMEKYGYIGPNIADNYDSNSNKSHKIFRRKKTIRKIKKKHKTLHSPPYKKKIKKKAVHFNDEKKSNSKNDDFSSLNRMKSLDDKNNNLQELNENSNNINNINIQNLNIVSIKKTNNRIKLKKKSTKKKISFLPTQGENNNKEKISNKDEKNFIKLNLININLNNRKSIKIKESDHVLNIYTFKEAIKYDYRSSFRIF